MTLSAESRALPSYALRGSGERAYRAYCGPAADSPAEKSK